MNRRIDQLGRLVIPKNLDIKSKDEIESEVRL